MKFNDLNYRIKVLFKSVDSYLNYHEIKEAVSTIETGIDEDGKELKMISFGGGEISESEIIDAQLEINSIIENLANLKDNLKNKFGVKGLQKQLVEDHINNNQSLQLITDLHNQIKHGYPLSLHKRSNLDPKIENIRHELVIPLGIGYTNVFSNGKVVYEADVLDKDGNLIYLFRELIENGIELWENFIVQHLPEHASVIIEKLEKKDLEELEFKRRNETQVLAEAIVNNSENWSPIEEDELKGGMFLKAIDKATQKEIWKGVSITHPFEKKGKTYITLRDVFISWFDNSYVTNEKNWKILGFKNQEEAELIHNHFYEMQELRKK